MAQWWDPRRDDYIEFEPPELIVSLNEIEPVVLYGDVRADKPCSPDQGFRELADPALCKTLGVWVGSVMRGHRSATCCEGSASS